MCKLSKEELSKIWERLIKSDPGPSNEDLVLILKVSKCEPLHERTWQKLLESEPSHSHLREVIERCGSVREQAGQKLLESEPSSEDLDVICCWVESLRDRAKEILCARSEATITVMDEIRSLNCQR